MRKIVAFLLVTTILLSMCISVSAAESDPQPRYINTNQAKIVMGISDSGLAEISITCIGNSNAQSIQSVTYIERQIGSSWVRVSNGQTGNQWTASSTARYLAKAYSCQLSASGTYRAVVVFTVAGTTSETITLYSEASF